MKELFKQIRGEFLLSSIVCIVLGIVLIIWGDAVLLMMGRGFGAIFVLVGVVNLASFFLNSMSNIVTGFLGAVVSVIGIWVMLDPGMVAKIIPIVLGVLLVFHGVKAVMVALESKKFGDERWWAGAILGAVSIVLGVLCIVSAFQIMTLAVALIGVALVYNGVSNIWLLVRANKVAKEYRSAHGTIDVEFKD